MVNQHFGNDQASSGGASREEVVEFLRKLTDLPLNNVSDKVKEIFNYIFAYMDVDDNDKISLEGELRTF